jgi:hypothetical protein
MVAVISSSTAGHNKMGVMWWYPSWACFNSVLDSGTKVLKCCTTGVCASGYVRSFEG